MKGSIIINAVRYKLTGDYMNDEDSACNYTPEDVLDGIIPPSELEGKINYNNLISDKEVAEIIGSKDREAIEDYKNAEENIYKDFVSDFEEVEIEFFFDIDEVFWKELRQEYEDDRSSFESDRNSYYGYCHGNRKEFSKMYGNGDYMSFEEWLDKEGHCQYTSYEVSTY